MKKLETIENSLKITRAELLAMFMDFKKHVSASGVTFANVVYQADESGSITVNKEKQLQKFVRTQITIGSSYEKRINRDLVKQGEEANFTAQAMSGKVHLNEMVCEAIKTGNKTLMAIIEHDVVAKTVYFHKGQRISKDKAIAQGLFMPSYFAEKKTAGRGNQSEETDFKTITLGFDKILSIRMNKVKYVIED
jgi:hypothetical protein